MIIHDARKEDIKLAVDVVKLSCALYKVPFDESTVLELMNKAIDSGWLLALVWDSDKVIGCTLVMKVPYYTDKNKIVCVEAIWHTLPTISNFKRAKAAVAMLNWQEEYARRNRCKLLTGYNNRGNTSHHLKPLFNSRGYKHVESIYEKEF